MSYYSIKYNTTLQILA